jgi:hypothetical protein
MSRFSSARLGWTADQMLYAIFNSTTITKNNSMKLRSSATLPIRRDGMKRLRNLSGGSVAEKMISAVIARPRPGLHDLL